MYVVSEEVAASIATVKDAIPSITDLLVQQARGETDLHPVAIGPGAGPSTVFGAKAGVIRGMGLIGTKIGSYWPDNPARGHEAHGATTMLLDVETGFPRALVGARRLSAIRTAALDAIAMRHLAREGSATLALIGAGNQAWWELQAALAVRPIERVLVWNRTPARARLLADRAIAELGIAAEAVAIETAVRSADIVICTSSAREPVVRADWVRPGTHVSAMGADVEGKQELDVELVRGASLYTDVVRQSVTLGEYEAAHTAGLIEMAKIAALCSVVAGDVPGRLSDEITIFDSSGMALPDLTIAQFVLDEALKRGLAQSVDL